MNTKKHYTLEDLERDYGPFTFGETLEAYRLADEISLKDFAKKLGMSPQSLCDLEKGRRLPSVDRVAKIAKKLQEPIEGWLSLALSDMVRAVKPNLKVEITRKIS
ncbi:MAG: helix-turn-helix transcriptional regulator [Bdellovibrionota bacterium]